MNIETTLRRAGSKLPQASDRVDDALREAAEREGLLDVAYTVVDSPVGPLVLAATKRGLVRLSFGNERVDDALEEVARTVSPRILEAPAKVDFARRELDEYFEGRRSRFDLPIDWRPLVGFRKRVLQTTARIPYGRVSTYREVATKAGSPRGSRAAGNALGSNPVAIVVPCHRVVATGGGLGGYGGGLERKEFLLRLEGALT